MKRKTEAQGDVLKDSKPFFFRIDLTELYDFATEPEGMKMSLLKFAKELKKGQSDYPQIQKIIDEAHEFIAKKSASGKKAMEIRYKDKPEKQKEVNTVITPLSTVITQPNDDITRSSSSTEAVTEAETITEDLKSKPLSGKPDGANGKYPYLQILAATNQILGTCYEDTKTFRALVKARINDGFKPEDFETVCKKKFAEWGSDLKMMQYLRPSTLFGSKMNDYLGSLTAGRPVSERERINFAAGQAFVNGEDDLWSNPTR